MLLPVAYGCWRQEGLYSHRATIGAIILVYLSGLIWEKIVTFGTSYPLAQTGNMDKVDYEAKLATELGKLQAYYAELENELRATASEATDGEPELVAGEVLKATEQKLLRAVDSATDKIIELIEHAEKEATQFNAAKYVIELARKEAPEKVNPIEELIGKLTGTPSPNMADTPDAA